MQASKIVPGTIYAMRPGKDWIQRFGENAVVRYRVTKVVTVNARTTAKGSPHDYISHVLGWACKADLPPNVTLLAATDIDAGQSETDESILFRTDPDNVIGPYEEMLELRERAATEKAEKDAQHVIKMRRAQALRLKLYALAGVTEIPQRPEEYKQLFRANYYSIDISEKGVEALVEALLMEEAAA